MKAWRILILLLPIAIACSDRGEPVAWEEPVVPPIETTGSDEYDVVSALVDTEFARTFPNVNYDLILIMPPAGQLESLPHDSAFALRFIANRIPQASKAVAEDLWRVTRTTYIWQDSLKTRIPYAWYGDTTVSHDLRVYGTLLLSRAGFNASHTEALVDAYLYCGTFCQAWFLCYFEKSHGCWILIKRDVYIMS
jgi:hypothetical protein